ncbi:MAG: DUF1735 domain-containing protein [Alistipes sp.]|nr:DUF1735 domain-containing protein [Alistipes sp.]
MKTFKSIFLLLCGATLLLAGCEDNREEYLDEYQSMIYFRNGGEQTLKLYRVGENTVYEIPVCKGGMDRNASGTAIISVMEQSQLEMYNLENGTNFRQLPEACFRFLTSTELVFESEDDYKIARVEMFTDDISAVQEADPDSDYVLALQVYADRAVSPDINLLILHPDIDIPYLSLSTSGLQSFSYTSESPDVNVYANNVVLGMDNRWDFSCDLAVRDQAWLDAYNAANGTSFALLPAENYSLPESVAFTSGTSRAAFDVSIDRRSIDLLKEYVLPVYIASCSKTQFAINEAASTVLLNVRLDPDKIALTADMASSPYTHGGDGQGTTALFDGDVSASSWWHSYYGGGPVGDPDYGYYIDITLPEPLSAVVFRYATRANPNAVPAEILIGVSNDGENWTELGRVSSDLPTGALEWATLPAFSHTESFAYVRFGVVRSSGGAGGLLTDPAGTSACVALSELELYGANLVN